MGKIERTESSKRNASDRDLLFGPGAKESGAKESGAKESGPKESGLNESGPAESRDPETGEAAKQIRRRTATRDPLPPESLEPRKDRGFQFRLRSLFMLTLAIAVGLAGRSWLPAKVFAGILTVIATIIIFNVEARELGDTRIDPLTIVLFVACCAAITVALLG